MNARLAGNGGSAPYCLSAATYWDILARDGSGRQSFGSVRVGPSDSEFWATLGLRNMLSYVSGQICARFGGIRVILMSG